jgi:poly-gamma-glutamate capsule biosynthesis protein CapA/YwtB (metallophosphatase superfamily)
MTLGAVPSFVIWASNYPLRAKVWVLQRNTPDFMRIDEASFVERFSPAQQAVKSPSQINIMMPLLLELFLT